MSKEEEIIQKIHYEGEETKVSFITFLKTNIYSNVSLSSWISFLIFVIGWPTLFTFVYFSEKRSPWDTMLYVILAVFVLFLLFAFVLVPYSLYSNSKSIKSTDNTYTEKGIKVESFSNVNGADTNIKMFLSFDDSFKAKETKKGYYFVFRLQKRNQRMGEYIKKEGDKLSEETKAFLSKKVYEINNRK